jgi:glucose-6-phosphate-specific signal transduction histidine kinase
LLEREEEMIATAPFNMTQTAIVSNSIGWTGLLTIVVVLFAVIALIFLISSIERYTAFFNAIEKIIKTIKYALYGAGISASVYAVYLLCGVITTVGKGFDPIIIAYAIGGYVVLVVIGCAGEFVAKRVKAMHNKYKEKKATEMTS